MRITYFIILFLFITSCKDDMVWNLSRKSPKDAKLEVSNLIYSNDCSNLAGFQFSATGTGTPSSIYWDLDNSGFSGKCIRTEGNCKDASVRFNVNMKSDGVLRFYIINTRPWKILVNSKEINWDHLGLTYEDWQKWPYPYKWSQIQTAVIKAGNNTIEIKYGSAKMDEIEIWTPKL